MKEFILGLVAIVVVIVGCIVSVFLPMLSIRKFNKEFAENKRKYSLEVLKEAFLMEKNDLVSRIDAWNEYRKLGGNDYINYYTKYLEPLIHQSETLSQADLDEIFEDSIKSIKKVNYQGQALDLPHNGVYHE